VKLVKSLAALVVATSALGAQAATNLVANGSFESPVLASGSFGFYTSMPGWSTFNVEVRNNWAGAAQQGSNFVELDTTANSSISQTINIAAPGAYQLSFWYDSRWDYGSSPSDTEMITWTFGTNNGSVLNNWTTDNTGTWKHYTGTFNFASAGLVGLTFAAGGTSDGLGGSLDNVSITAVPEPETYAMLLAGMGLMGTIARRRKAKQA
jgi:hypothetical protein